MIPLLPPIVHAWLDETVLPLYLAFAWWFRPTGPALALLIYAGIQHFVVTRVTRYPRGTWPLLSFRVHALFDGAEGLLLAGGGLLMTAEPAPIRTLLLVLGALQIGAFALSDTRWPPPRG